MQHDIQRDKIGLFASRVKNKVIEVGQLNITVDTQTQWSFLCRPFSKKEHVVTTEHMWDSFDNIINMIHTESLVCLSKSFVFQHSSLFLFINLYIQ